MNECEDESLNSFELQLLWDGVEDFTGLWQAEALARKLGSDLPGVIPRHRARRSLERLVENGLVVVYACRGVPTDETCDQLGLEELPKVLDEGTSWIAPEEGGIGIWYDTNDDGFDAYRMATDWQ